MVPTRPYNCSDAYWKSGGTDTYPNNGFVHYGVGGGLRYYTCPLSRRHRKTHHQHIHTYIAHIICTCTTHAIRVFFPQNNPSTWHASATATLSRSQALAQASRTAFKHASRWPYKRQEKATRAYPGTCDCQEPHTFDFQMKDPDVASISYKN